MERFIGVDIGGTNTKIGIVTREGELIEKTGYQRGGPEAYVAHIKEILAQ